MATDKVIQPLSERMGSCLIFFSATIITFIILKTELKTRKNSSITFTTKWLKSFSILCIISSFLSPLLFLVAYIPGLCFFLACPALISILIAILSMGFYQLSRLYYCFANSQIHSNKGYPKCLFIFMYSFGIIMVILAIISAVIINNVRYGLINSQCGFTKNLYLYYEPVQIDEIKSSAVLVWTIIFLLAFWDISTLCLYLYQIKKFFSHKDQDPAVYKRIMSILHKITILTSFYQFTQFIMSCGGWSIAGIFGDESLIYKLGTRLFMCTISILLSVSMYLMMDHNVDKYIKFLSIFRILKLHWICLCCKWRYFVIEQLEELHSNDGGTFETEIDRKKKTSFDTKNISSTEEKQIQKTGMELSIEVTMTNYKKSSFSNDEGDDQIESVRL